MIIIALSQLFLLQPEARVTLRISFIDVYHLRVYYNVESTLNLLYVD